MPVDVTGARVLVIDDNPVNREILLEQLRSWGFDCAAAESGAIGLAFLDRAAQLGAAVDCVILDYQMPGMNGADVAKAMCSDVRTASIPVVLLTSVDQVDFAPHGARLRHRRASDQAGALGRTSRHRDRRHPEGAQPGRPGRVHPRAGASRCRAVPVAPAPRPSPRCEEAASARPGVPLDILVAEDNEVNQLVFAQILSGLGLSYRIAGNGRTAVEMHRALKPKLILMDVSMPELNGYEATQAIRAAEAEIGAHTPIIGVTAHALKGDSEKCIEAGMDDYLPKPVSPDRLSAKIGAWLSEAEMAKTA